MSTGTLIILVVVGYFILKILLSNARKNANINKYGEEFGTLINKQKIDIGMSKEMVTAALGTPGKSDGVTHKENFVKEVLYYRAFKDEKQKVQFRYKIIFVNDKVTEFHII
jgi:outer membrane protein assembly factor BamE (lipoprotein component of BamABCDE complex)